MDVAEKFAVRMPDFQNLGTDGIGRNVSDGVFGAIEAEIFLGGRKGAFCILRQRATARQATQIAQPAVVPKKSDGNVERLDSLAIFCKETHHLRWN